MKSRHSKKETVLERKYLLVAMVVISLIIAIVYIVNNIPSPSGRYVKAQIIEPPGLVYNSTSDELKFWLNCTPSDNNTYLSRVTSPNNTLNILMNERVYENGTIIEFNLNNYSIYAGTPYSGAEVALDLYFSDLNTNEDVAKVELRVKYP